MDFDQPTPVVRDEPEAAPQDTARPPVRAYDPYFSRLFDTADTKADEFDDQMWDA
jgi:hypothetical protein